MQSGLESGATKLSTSSLQDEGSEAGCIAPTRNNSLAAARCGLEAVHVEEGLLKAQRHYICDFRLVSGDTKISTLSLQDEMSEVGGMSLPS